MAAHIGHRRAPGARVVNTKEPQLILDGTVYVSGEIARVTPFERGFPEQHRKTPDGQGWEPDPLTMDERFVAVNVANKGLMVFTACSHAGVINVVHEVHPNPQRKQPCTRGAETSQRSARKDSCEP